MPRSCWPGPAGACTAQPPATPAPRWPVCWRSPWTRAPPRRPTTRPPPPPHGNLARAPDHWQDFTAHAHHAGYTTAHALPLRLRQDTLGSLLLLGATVEPLPPADLALAQAFADAATIGLLHSRTLKHTETVNQQLHTALHSRIVIEQAKGILATQHHITLNHAFDAMRRHARNHGILLTNVAHSIIDTGRLPDPPSSPQGNTPPTHRDPSASTE